MTGKYDIAVIGGGPAGSIMAHDLAEAGAKVLLFDHSHPRAKPCSGFLIDGIFALHPLMKDFSKWRAFNGPRRYRSPAGHTFTIRGDQAITRFDLSSRKDLDGYLIEAAQKAGAHWVKERVVDLQFSSGQWRILTEKTVWSAGTIAGADGAKSLVRKKLIGAFAKQDLVIGVGKTLPQQRFDELHTVFIKGGGIGFILPGYDFTQVVLGDRLPDGHTLATRLRQFIAMLPVPFQASAPTWAAVQPSCITRDFFRQKCAGRHFCLIGDAAGHSDPLNGEGIPFAILGATLAAKAFLSGRLSDFDSMWKDSYGNRFEKAAAKVRRAPGLWTRDLAGWAFAKSPCLIEGVTAGLAENHSLLFVAKKLVPRLPRVLGELIR